MTATHLTRPRTLSALGAIAALAITLAACGNGGAEGAEGAEETASATPTAEETETGAAAAETTDAPAASGDVAACVIGTWEMDTDALQEQMAELMGGPDAEVDIEMTVEGHSRVTLDGETWTSDVDTSSTFRMAAGDQSLEGASSTVGTIVMGYVIEGDQMRQTEVVSAEGTATTTFGGQEQTVDFGETAEGSLGVPQTVTCDATTMTLTVADEGISMTQEFTRR